VAVVGTRTPTPYGRKAASRLSHDLALGGFAIVSGLARGIDSAAHEGALEAGGHTIGVLGHGIEQVYPPEARLLYRRMRERGLILTEYPPGETPRPGNFPRRNRLITALSQAVLVVEMGVRSGAQHTVAYALEQGKEVMAVPGPIGFPSSEGTNQLIKDGARVVTSAADVIEELFGVGRERAVGGLTTGAERSADAPTPVAAPPSLALATPAEQSVLDALGPTLSSIDEIAETAGMRPADAVVVLLDLELRGAVQSAPGMRYARLPA
jgi:DNA processing protein